MAKTVNYTKEQTEKLVAAYTSAETENERDSVVEEFAEQFNKSVRSIVAKLSREKVYVKKQRTTKNGGEIVKKEELASRIAEKVGVAPETFDSLAKANKDVLNKILQHIAHLENNIKAMEQE